MVVPDRKQAVAIKSIALGLIDSPGVNWLMRSKPTRRVQRIRYTKKRREKKKKKREEEREEEKLKKERYERAVPPSISIFWTDSRKRIG